MTVQVWTNNTQSAVSTVSSAKVVSKVIEYKMPNWSYTIWF